MPRSSDRTTSLTATGLAEKGYVYVPGNELAYDRADAEAWLAFAAAWNSLPLDPYISVASPYRYRRYSKWRWEPSSATGPMLGEHVPYYQERDVNHLAGGIQRVFSPLAADAISSPVLARILAYDVWLVETAMGASVNCWAIDTHMVRITSSFDQDGLPAPEGVHRDGLDFVAIHLIGRQSVVGGTTTVYDENTVEIARVELTATLDSLLLDDRRCQHYTSPIASSQGSAAAEPGRRDVLLVGLRAAG